MRGIKRLLPLYQQAEPETPTPLAQAECHHRLGNLLANVLIDTPDRVTQAIAHYEQALTLYDAGEIYLHTAREDRRPLRPCPARPETPRRH